MTDDKLTLQCYGDFRVIYRKIKDAYDVLEKNGLTPLEFNFKYEDLKNEASATLVFDKERLPDESRLKEMLGGLGFSQIKKI